MKLKLCYKKVKFPPEIMLKKVIEPAMEAPKEDKTLNLFLENEFTVVLAGLDMDFKAEPFELVKELMPRADYLYKHHAVCANCGVDAWVSYRKTHDDERIKLGAAESYEPLCRKCYYEKEKIRKQMENQLSMLEDE